MIKKAVITGDIIKSRNIKDKEKLVNVLQYIFDDLTSQFEFDNPFDIYRGDSFQALIGQPKDSLRIATLIRLGLQMNGMRWDARIGIGIGTVSYTNQNIKISNGLAFELSGRGLDEIKKTKKRIQIKVENEKINKQLETFNRLAEAIIRRWSKKTAEVVYSLLLFNETQKQIALKIGISQSAVQQRIAAADFETIIMYIRYFENDLAL
jgi:hypothetical protein